MDNFTGACGKEKGRDHGNNAWRTGVAPIHSWVGKVLCPHSEPGDRKQAGDEVAAQLGWTVESTNSSTIYNSRENIATCWQVITSPCSLPAQILNHSALVVYGQISVALRLAVGLAYQVPDKLSIADCWQTLLHNLPSTSPKRIISTEWINSSTVLTQLLVVSELSYIQKVK